MTTGKFDEVVDMWADRIKRTLKVKQAEYNLGADRLEFFKHAAGISNELPSQALYGFLLKQLTSEAEMVQSGGKFTEERWAEKIGDILNYNILLYAVLADTGMFEESEAKKDDEPGR